MAKLEKSETKNETPQKKETIEVELLRNVSYSPSHPHLQLQKGVCRIPIKACPPRISLEYLEAIQKNSSKKYFKLLNNH